jgi:hypothetical protein
MDYYSTTLATTFPARDWRVRFFYLLFFFVPRANPDFEPLFPRVRRWLVEVDDSGNAVRELGLDEQGVPVTAGPWERNYGFWTDSPGPFPSESADPVAQSVFAQAWATFAANRVGA